MFLGDPDNMNHMSLTDEERDKIARRLLREQKTRFGDVKLRAYQAAGVNYLTWENAIRGRGMKDHKIHQIVVNLWPETEGEWRLIPGIDGSDSYDAVLDAIERSDFTEENKKAMRAVVEADRRGDTVQVEQGDVVSLTTRRDFPTA